MKLSVLKEVHPNEARVALTPDLVKKYQALGFDVCIQSGAGMLANFEDKAYKDQGAVIKKSVKEVVSNADIILMVQPPKEVKAYEKLIQDFPEKAFFIAMQNPFDHQERFKLMHKKKISTFALEWMPRITRAQNMDVLSSQTNLAGYYAVLLAASEYKRSLPLMMTAAGTVAPAKVMVMGAGVAGLQAIATAKRMGAVVSATDVRQVAKEQVESLGGKFVTVESDEIAQNETKGGYAKETSKAFQKAQEKLIKEVIKKQDIVICTALIPGKPAPKLITKEMVSTMPKGSVIIDMAIERGGNCELSKYNACVESEGVKIIAYDYLTSRLSDVASQLYAKNCFNFVTYLVDEKQKKIKIDTKDEIISGTLITHQGKWISSHFVTPKVTQKKTAKKDLKV